MSNKFKITLSLSAVLALVFSLPWITLVEQTRLANFGVKDPAVMARVSFIFVTVFLVSIVLFGFNFFWKHRLISYAPRRGWLIAITGNTLCVIALTACTLVAAIAIFDIKATRAYFMVYLFRHLIVAAVVILVAYVVDLMEKLRQERIEILMLQHQNAETELAVLRSQIDPHFLFNTLTTLSSLARNDSKDTVTFIDHMADTFRYMLENRAQKVVTVRDELSFLQSYLFMMKKRFGEGIQVSIDIKNEYLDKVIPQFALQTVVENAIKHNIVSPRQALRIELKSSYDSLTVRNDLREKKWSQGYGIGLDNLSQRYWLMGKKQIKVTKAPDAFEVTLPFL